MKVRLKEKIKKFPKSPGVYLMKNHCGEIIYIGKASSLRDRVESYFAQPHDQRIEKLIAEIFDVDYKKTPTVIEALILEANLIKKYQPKFNVKEKDDKSFLYLGFTKENFPQLLLLRRPELKKNIEAKQRCGLRHKTPNSTGVNWRSYGVSQLLKIFGPFTSASSLRAALGILRKIFPYRDCVAFPKRPCLQYHLKRCGAPCAGLISQKDYQKNIRNLILFFEGKKEKIIKNLKKQMDEESRKENFEKAAKLRNQIFALEHIQDVAVIKNEESRIKNQELSIDIFGRIEGYDISNISGTSATGSMVVFIDGKPQKSEYRRFKIKTVHGANDVAMLKEILTRRLRRIKNHESGIREFKNHNSYFIIHNSKIWPLPDLILVDGGWGQINAACEVLAKHKVKIPVIGIAKGFDRKQDRLIYDKENLELSRVAEQYKNLLLAVRNEAHRFAQSYHKILRRKKLIGK